MKTLSILIILLTTVIFTSCTTEPEPINYGEDSCNYCEMTIVSQVHSARAVSKKGKQFKYDAIECMMNHSIQEDAEMSVRQVALFNEPGVMVEVERAVFVIHDSINSPMGANLAALKSNGEGDSEALFSWNELRQEFLKETSVTSNN